MLVIKEFVIMWPLMFVIEEFWASNALQTMIIPSYNHNWVLNELSQYVSLVLGTQLVSGSRVNGSCLAATQGPAQETDPHSWSLHSIVIAKGTFGLWVAVEYRSTTLEFTVGLRDVCKEGASTIFTLSNYWISTDCVHCGQGVCIYLVAVVSCMLS